MAELRVFSRHRFLAAGAKHSAAGRAVWRICPHFSHCGGRGRRAAAAKKRREDGFATAGGHLAECCQMPPTPEISARRIPRQRTPKLARRKFPALCREIRRRWWKVPLRRPTKMSPIAPHLCRAKGRVGGRRKQTLQQQRRRRRCETAAELL